MSEPDLQAFYDALPSVRATPDGKYTLVDRYRDFREVFGTDAGRRVLSQILSEAEGLPLGPGQIESHPYMAYRAGQRAVGLRIVQWMNAIPVEAATENDDG